MPDVTVLDSTMYYEDIGDGSPVVLLHGNPTSSYLWRNVIPELTGQARCLAPDLIGMGPGAIMTPPTITWCQDHIAALDVEHVGPGLHFVQEDNGPSIGIVIAAWRHRHGLAPNLPHVHRF